MSFVVVFLKYSKQYVVVPEDWIQDLNNAKLKNNGRNSNQDFLLFWSGTNHIPNIGKIPDFSAEKTPIFHSTHDGVCYTCRIKKFFGN